MQDEAKIMENYPSLAEGNGLENRQVEKSARGFESHILLRHEDVAIKLSRDGAVW